MNNLLRLALTDSSLRKAAAAFVFGFVSFTSICAQSPDTNTTATLGNAEKPTLSNPMASDELAAQKQGFTNLVHRLGGALSETLRTNHFMETQTGLFSRTNVTLGDVKRVLHFENSELRPVMSSAASDPVARYWIDFGDARCLMTIRRDAGESSGINLGDDTTVVDVTITTNRVSAGRVLSPK